MTGCHPQDGGLSVTQDKDSVMDEHADNSNANMKKDAEDMARIDDQSDQSRMVKDAGDKAVAGDDELQEESLEAGQEIDQSDQSNGVEDAKEEGSY